MRAMTIRIADEAFEVLEHMQEADGIPPSTRCRAWILYNIADLQPPPPSKGSKAIDELLENSGIGTTRKSPTQGRSPNAKKRKR